MHPKSRSVRRGEHGFERIEAGRLVQELRGARLDAIVEIRVAAAAHLDEQRVERVIAGRNRTSDAMLSGDVKRGAQHPECANFAWRVGFGGRCRRRHPGRGHHHRGGSNEGEEPARRARRESSQQHET